MAPSRLPKPSGDVGDGYEFNQSQQLVFNDHYDVYFATECIHGRRRSRGQAAHAHTPQRVRTATVRGPRSYRTYGPTSSSRSATRLSVCPCSATTHKNCTWLLWVPPVGGVQSEYRMSNAGTLPDTRPIDGNGQPRVLLNNACTGMLAFVAHPRTFDMFREHNNLARPIDYQVTNPVGRTFQAYFSPGNTAHEGQETYVIESRSRRANSCVAPYNTRLEAVKLYQSRTGGTYQAAFPQLKLYTFNPPRAQTFTVLSAAS